MSDQGGTPGGWRRGVALWLLPVAAAGGAALGAAGVRVLAADEGPLVAAPPASVLDAPATTSSTTPTLTSAAGTTTVPAGAREVGRYKGSTDIDRTPPFNVGATWAVLATVSGGGDGFSAEVFRAGDDPSSSTPVESIHGSEGPVMATLTDGGRFFLSIRSGGVAFEVLVLDLQG